MCTKHCLYYEQILKDLAVLRIILVREIPNHTRLAGVLSCYCSCVKERDTLVKEHFFSNAGDGADN